MYLYNVRHPVDILIFGEQIQPYRYVISKPDSSSHPFSLKYLGAEEQCFWRTVCQWVPEAIKHVHIL